MHSISSFIMEDKTYLQFADVFLYSGWVIDMDSLGQHITAVSKVEEFL